MFLSRYLYRGDYKNYEIKQSYFRDLVIASYVKDMLLVSVTVVSVSVKCMDIDTEGGNVRIPGYFRINAPGKGMNQPFLLQATG